MKKLISILNALVLTIAAEAQTLNVQVGNVTYQFPASQTGDMTYTDGTRLTILNKTFALNDISCMLVDDTSVTDNLVSIKYSTSGDAAVTVAGNVAQYVTATVSGNHVTITQMNTAAVNGDEIIYQLSGTTTDGSLTMSGSYKCTVSLAGVTMTNPSGAAITITNSKRIQLSAKSGTTNTITDGSGPQKACIYSKGQLQLQGNGMLNVVGNHKHGIMSASYVSIKNLTLNITSTVGDGINCEEYFQMKSGSVSISGVGDDGIQCDLGGTASTGQTTDHEDEDTGNVYLEGGTLSVQTTTAAAKGIKADGDMVISDGTITVTNSGSATWDSGDSEVKGSACISADGNMTISGGVLTLTNEGSGGKGIKADGKLAISDNANLTVNITGQIAYCSSSSNTTIRTTTSTSTTERLSDNLSSSPKGIKADGAMTITGGTILVSASYHEAIETKSTLDISGGYLYATSMDDAINSSSHMTISGGYIMANSTGNDGLDANGNLYISGGNVFAVAKSNPEVGIDANTEGGYKLYITGGSVVAIGGFERDASISDGTAKSASSFSKGTWYGLYNGSTPAFAFKVPSNSSMGSTMAVYTTSTPSLKSSVTAGGTSFWNGYGYTSCSGGSDVTLSTYNNGGGGGQPGGGGNPGGGHGGH